MNITFRRIDYAQVGTTSDGCLQIINFDKDEKKNKSLKSFDKVVIGGQNGVLFCLARKNNDTSVSVLKI